MAIAGLGQFDSSVGGTSQYYGTAGQQSKGFTIGAGLGAKDSTLHASSQYYGTSGSPAQQQTTFFAGFDITTWAGMTWMKTVYLMTREYWSAISGPFRGQLYPYSGNARGAGQQFPF